MLSAEVLLGGRYRIQEVLGRGGMGEVYRAKDQRSGQEVAVKSTDLGRWGPTQRASLLDQFRREGQTLLRLQHPNLPTFLDYLEEDDQAFLVMELVPGCNLAEHVQVTGPLPEGTLIQYIEQLASVLEYLHGQVPPVIFRDLKPSNVMLMPDGELKLIDFGLAKSLHNGSGEATHTSARGLVSPGFAAPEQYSGGTDERSDLYALGATAYFLATGTTPTESVERATSGSGLPSADRVNPHLSAATAMLISRLMQLKRDKRPASARQVLEQLRVRPSADVQTVAVKPTPRRRRWRIGVAVGLLSLGAWWYFPASTSPMHLETSPPGASVFVDGTALGITPCNLTVTSQSKLRLELKGYYSVEEQPTQFTREPLSLFLVLRPGTPPLGASQESLPGFYPAGRGGPPGLMLPRTSDSLEGHAYGFFPEFTKWNVLARGNGKLEMQEGDGHSGTRRLLRLEVKPSGPLEELLQAQISGCRADWTAVRILRQQHTALVYFENRQGAVAGRAAWLLRLSPQRSLQFWLEIVPCQDPYAFLRDLELLRSCLRLRENDPV